MPKFNFTASPFSVTVDKETSQKFQQAILEIDPILRKYGFDTYLLSVHRSVNGRGLCSSAISTLDPEEATLLVSDAFRAVNELVQTQTPNAPGGAA